LAGPHSAGAAWEVDIRIVLDITRLVREGKLSEDEADRLRALASRDTGTLAINILMLFGAIAVAAGILALNPSFETGAALGVTLVLIGLGVIFAGSDQWSLLGTAITVIGALLLSGGMIGLFEAQIPGMAFTAFLLLVIAALIQSAFLMALVPFALAGVLGSSTGYSHATYMLIVSEPTITIVIFSLLAALAYFVSQRLEPVYEKLAIIFARMSLLLVNFGFWVGSLWGDRPGESWVHGETYPGSETWEKWQAWRETALRMPDYAFVIAWALLLLGVGVWGARVNRRWVVNTAAAFGAIHFYTQWFERLGAQPWAIIIAGLTVVAVAVALWRYNVARGGSSSSGIVSA
jgi:iron complex transport system permease protein